VCLWIEPTRIAYLIIQGSYRLRHLTHTCPEGALLEDSAVFQTRGTATLVTRVPPQSWSN
jgi:hypothetical protein